MNTYRNVVVALAAGAACLSLAACSAGITTASSAGADAASSRSAAAVASSASAAAMASASASASRAAAGRMIKLDGLSVSFPVPTGAKVIENMAMNVDGKQTAIFFTLVTPAKVASFYTAALPRDGYKVTSNSLLSQTGSTVAFIQFSGHGIKGTIDSLAKFTESVGIPGLGHKNVTTISLQAK
ncbi:MAG TPA: hypothetical protein VFW50_07220 [Streptosporangiaceae bacterium]|nr:hypothetical protein [Streptosporangiaceae bacterium]